VDTAANLTAALSTLDAIDDLLGHTDRQCAHCQQETTGSASTDFCSEDCQTAWHTNNAAPEWPSGSATPNPGLPDAPGEPALTWLLPRSIERGRSTSHILDAVTTFVRRFSAFPSEHCAPTLALWYAHTHLAEHFYVTPRLILDSAEPGSGKTRVLEVAQYLVAAPEMTLSASRAALFRMVAAGPITILFDEVDTIFNGKAGGGNEDLRALLNAGYKRSATIPRYDAKTRSVQRFPVYTPAALAGIAGGMPDTITTRAITIHMRRRHPDERVDPFRERLVEQQAAPLRTELARWAASIAGQVSTAEPGMPDGVTDRSAEIWEPLIAIADAAGGHWPETARAACRYFVLARTPDDESLGIELLSDLRSIFATAETDRISTKSILAALLTLPDAPWSSLPEGPLTARRLARELNRYGVSPVVFAAKTGRAKGYVTFATSGKQSQVGLTDAWTRYLPTDQVSQFPGNAAGQAVVESSEVT
jgi:hypothetical protein